jgi:hypothetical protein
MGVWMKKHNKSDVGLEPKLGVLHLNELGKDNWNLRDLKCGGARGHLKDKRVAKVTQNRYYLLYVVGG